LAAQIAIAVLLFPVATRLVAWIERKRERSA
jgi:Zn-dependent protease with chaperone function